MNIDLKDFIEGNDDLFTLCTYKEAESVLNKFLEWRKEAISDTRCCETFTCDVCYTETSNKKDDEDYRYCDSCNEM
jgi:hypothetical protein